MLLGCQSSGQQATAITSATANNTNTPSSFIQQLSSSIALPAAIGGGNKKSTANYSLVQNLKPSSNATSSSSYTSSSQIAPELSELVIYTQAVKFRDLNLIPINLITRTANARASSSSQTNHFYHHQQPQSQQQQSYSRKSIMLKSSNNNNSNNNANNSNNNGNNGNGNGQASNGGANGGANGSGGTNGTKQIPPSSLNTSQQLTNQMSIASSDLTGSRADLQQQNSITVAAIRNMRSVGGGGGDENNYSHQIVSLNESKAKQVRERDFLFKIYSFSGFYF